VHALRAPEGSSRRPRWRSWGTVTIAAQVLGRYRFRARGFSQAALSKPQLPGPPVLPGSDGVKLARESFIAQVDSARSDSQFPEVTGKSLDAASPEHPGRTRQALLEPSPRLPGPLSREPDRGNLERLSGDCILLSAAVPNLDLKMNLSNLKLSKIKNCFDYELEVIEIVMDLRQIAHSIATGDSQSLRDGTLFRSIRFRIWTTSN
jgi:hypothetical protein